MAGLPRFTKNVVQKILDQNNGFVGSTFYKAKNITVNNVYKIVDGVMYRIESGKTSWSDSRFKDESVCDLKTTRRVLKQFLDKLNLDGIE